ncbi:MAG: DNA polymerase III subunit delta [Nitrospirales bacterium]|nr:DNA polymerase III subunit delta [Nitrospirales bacterium]
MKHYEIQKDIQRNGLSPVYLILGEEGYLCEQALQVIRRHVLGRQQPSEPGADSACEDDPYVCELLYGDETDGGEIADRAREVSIFSSHRLLIVKWAEKLSAKDGEAFIPYLETPSDFTTIVLVASKLDGRQKWVQSLKARATLIECPPLFDQHRLGWVTQEARRLGIQLKDSAAQELKDLAADGLYTVRQELDKLACYVPMGQPVSHHDIDAVRGAKPGMSVFDLANALASGRRGQALRIVSQNLESGEAPLRILGSLVWQFRRIWKAKDSLTQGIAESHVARSLGIPPFKQREFFALVRSFSTSRLQNGFHLFEKTDSALKGGAAGSPSRILEGMVLALAKAA